MRDTDWLLLLCQSRPALHGCLRRAVVRRQRKARPSSGLGIQGLPFLGGSTGPPNRTVTAPSNGATISGSSVSLTATCTPQGTATLRTFNCSWMARRSARRLPRSPYTMTLDSTKISNGTHNHSIYAIATDSNRQTGTSGTVTVTVNNSAPGCVTSDPRAIFSQGITNQTGTFSATWTEKPNSAANDTDFGLSPAAATGFSSMSSLLLADNSGVWLAWNNAVAAYAAVNSAPYVTGTAYSFSGTFTFSAGSLVSYSISETSPSSIVIASGYTPRASATGLAFWNLISDQGLYDTAQLCNFQVGTSTSLGFAPSSVNFGNVTVGATVSQTITITSAGGATTFSSVTGLSGDLSIFSNGCTGSQTSCTTVIHYTPSATGTVSQTVTYTDSATGSPQTVAITGTGIPAAPSATPSPTSVNFGNVQLGHSSTSGPVTVALLNGPVTFTSITYDNAVFSSASSTCVGSVAGPSCQVTPQCTPSSLTTFMGTMTLHDNAPTGGSTQTVSLICTGVNFPTPSPATQFVFSLPIQHSVPLVVNGVALGTLADNFTCQLTCIPKSGATPPWSCSCQ